MSKIVITEEDLNYPNCPYCSEDIEVEQPYYCPACGVPHHKECWEENGGCTGYGCSEAPVHDPDLTVYGEHDTIYGEYDINQTAYENSSNGEQEIASNNLTGKKYGGIRRLPFIGIQIGLMIGVALFSSNITNYETEILMMVLWFIGSYAALVYRVINTGKNAWYTALIFIPFIGGFISFYWAWVALICQEGYEEEEKLDDGGKVATYILGALLLLVFILIFMEECS